MTLEKGAVIHLEEEEEAVSQSTNRSKIKTTKLVSFFAIKQTD